mmetsp:Transcript_27335/g.83097  ORF Transcript_27335/g.83097 Transcript_27335/m.83097 type:complete len:359 (+) Transcript_27335:974-2050(+)|eukprot:scaffold281122_cov23-Tisochrysis_lutea.AAC.2
MSCSQRRPRCHLATAARSNTEASSVQPRPPTTLLAARTSRRHPYRPKPCPVYRTCVRCASLCCMRDKRTALARGRFSCAPVGRHSHSPRRRTDCRQLPRAACADPPRDRHCPAATCPQEPAPVTNAPLPSGRRPQLRGRGLNHGPGLGSGLDLDRPHDRRQGRLVHGPLTRAQGSEALTLGPRRWPRAPHGPSTGARVRRQPEAAARRPRLSLRTRSRSWSASCCVRPQLAPSPPALRRARQWRTPHPEAPVPQSPSRRAPAGGCRRPPHVRALCPPRQGASVHAQLAGRSRQSGRQRAAAGASNASTFRGNPLCTRSDARALEEGQRRRRRARRRASPPRVTRNTAHPDRPGRCARG